MDRPRCFLFSPPCGKNAICASRMPLRDASWSRGERAFLCAFCIPVICTGASLEKKTRKAPSMSSRAQRGICFSPSFAAPFQFLVSDF